MKKKKRNANTKKRDGDKRRIEKENYRQVRAKFEEKVKKSITGGTNNVDMIKGLM